MHAALTRHADSLRSAGDPRTRGQLMADALVERTTGTPGGITGIEIQLVMTDRTLFQGDSEPARLPGYGIVPAGWARELLKAGEGKAAGARQEPERARRAQASAAGEQGELAWGDCELADAPIRHLDHIIPWHHGGPTTQANGAGLCEACNHTKETPGWSVRPRPGPRHTLEIQTPTGHSYHSTAPPLPGTRRRDAD